MGKFQPLLFYFVPYSNKRTFFDNHGNPSKTSFQSHNLAYSAKVDILDLRIFVVNVSCISPNPVKSRYIRFNFLYSPTLHSDVCEGVANTKICSFY